MKNDRTDPKRGPKSDAKPRSKPASKRESGPDDEKRPKREARSESGPKLSQAERREQRLEVESSLKKEVGAKAKTSRSSGGDFSPKTGLNRPSPKSAEPRKTGAAPKVERGATQAFPPKRYINVYLSLGSNMGDRAAYLRDAAGMIDKNIGKIARKSHVYETQPWGESKQDLFFNQVLMVNTTLDPRDLLEIITHIEKELGRVKTEKWGPRTIDIDILFYGKRIIRDKGLDIPHPELHKRGFVLVPMMEIAPELEHPVFKQPIDELYMACKDPAEVVMLD